MRTISADPDEIDVFQHDVEEDDCIPTFQQEDDESSDDYEETDNVSGSVSSSSIGSNSSSTTSRFVAENSHNTDVHDVKPDVPDEFKPNNLMRFRTVNDAIDMYRSYAEKAGFDVRLNTERKSGEKVIHKYLICHRNSKPPNKSVEIKNKRNTHYRSTDCKAKIVIKHIDGSTDYKFDKFEELHNHEMEEAFHLRKNRKLSFSDKELIMRASTAKIGATKAYKLKATLKGGFEQVKGKVVDFKNFTRDMGSIIGSNDAQFIVNKLLDRKENYPNASYYHRLDENKVLNTLFWANETDKAYYNEFGDVMSFDATFRTNKSSPAALFSTIQELSREQIICVRRMGFGELINMKITEVPGAIAYYMLDNFDTTTNKINLLCGSIEVTTDLVNHIMGFPVGTMSFDDLQYPDTADTTYSDWQSQCDKKNTIRINEIKTKIILSDEADINFKLNFLAIMINSLIESSLHGKANYAPLKYITKETNIRKINWCEFLAYISKIFNLRDNLLGFVEDAMDIFNDDNELKLYRRLLRKIGDLNNKKQNPGNDDAGRENENVDAGAQGKSLTAKKINVGEENCSEQVSQYWSSPSLKNLINSPLRETTAGYMETIADAIGDQTFSSSLADRDSNENKTDHEGNTQQNASETRIVNEKNVDSIMRGMESNANEGNEQTTQTQTKNDEQTTQTQTKNDEKMPVVEQVHEVERPSLKVKFFVNNSPDLPAVKRLKTAAPANRSPYKQRAICLTSRLTHKEKIISDFVFNLKNEPLDEIMITDNGYAIFSYIFESLFPDQHIAYGVIDIWVHILNLKELERDVINSPRGLFIPIDLTISFIFYLSYKSSAYLEIVPYNKDPYIRRATNYMTNEERYAMFKSKFEQLFQNQVDKTLRGIDMVFFPVIRSNHIYLYVFDLKNTKVAVLDNLISDEVFSEKYVHLKTLIRYFIRYLQEVNHTRSNNFSSVLIPKEVFETVSMTRYNKVDCGVFVMRNMEVYKGETEQHYNSGIPVENDFQKLLLSRMRSKYLHSILLSHINLQKEQILERARKYAKLDPKKIEYDRRLAGLAIDTRLHMFI
ncbi:hypothetical protein LXL04_018215 [Taraxacum kok-saghyz]